MGWITLEGMEFFAYHGYYDEEQKIGNKYAIDLSIQTDLHRAAQTDRLKETIDYTAVYRIVAEVMQQKHRLLEHVGFEIIHRLKEQFSEIQKIVVKVSKFNPPIGGVCAKAQIQLEA